MICDRCADAADGVDFGPVPVCSECGVGPIFVYRTDVPLEEQKVVFHKHRSLGSGRKVKCPGTGKPPRLQTGHDFCKGCDCKHKPVGSHTCSTVGS